MSSEKKEPVLTGYDQKNPYVAGQAGRKEWNDRYFNMKNSIRHWQWAFGATCVVCLSLTGVIAYQTTQSHIQPFVVETSQGMPIAMRPMEAISEKDHRLINYAVNQFIINAKTRVADKDAQSALLRKAYAFSADSAIPFLRTYYHTSDPFTLAQPYTVSVTILHAMPVSAHTWQVTWDETKRHRNDGHLSETVRWMAQLHIQVGEVNPLFVNDNPFGIYITDIHWSPNQSTT